MVKVYLESAGWGGERGCSNQVGETPLLPSTLMRKELTQEGKKGRRGGQRRKSERGVGR